MRKIKGKNRKQKKAKNRFVCFVELSLVLLIITAVFDCVPRPYWTDGLAAFFSYQPDNLISIALVVWTFSATLIIYYLERKEERYYGIRLMDILLWQEEKNSFFFSAVCFMSQLAIFSAAVAAKWMITITAFVVIQFLLMGLLLHFVYSMTSSEAVLSAIRRQTRKRMGEVCDANKLSFVQTKEKSFQTEWFLVKMIGNLNYSDRWEVEELLRILLEEVFSRADSHTGRCVVRSMMEYLLDTAEDTKIFETLLLNLYTEKRTTWNARKGMIAALLQDISLNRIHLCKRLLKVEIQQDLSVVAEERSRKQIMLCKWMLYYNAFFLTESEYGIRLGFQNAVFRMLPSGEVPYDSQLIEEMASDEQMAAETMFEETLSWGFSQLGG